MNVKELRKIYSKTQLEVAVGTGIPRDRIAKWEQGKGSPKADDEKTLAAYFGKLQRELVPPVNNNGVETAHDKSIRKPKTEQNASTDGITFIPISAQAGYSRSFKDPLFENSLERLYIPGFPYRGDRYRVWEVEGQLNGANFQGTLLRTH